jgi:hypothetical protein
MYVGNGSLQLWHEMQSFNLRPDLGPCLWALRLLTVSPWHSSHDAKLSPPPLPPLQRFSYIIKAADGNGTAVRRDNEPHSAHLRHK